MSPAGSAGPGAGGTGRARVAASVRAPVRLTPEQLLAHAYGLLDDPPPVFASRWPRGVALLARQALETSLAELWAKRAVKIGWATERSQLICLPAIIGDRALAADANLAWNGLSAACHQHPYNLLPTAGELAGWLETVDRLRRAVDAVPGPPVSDESNGSGAPGAPRTRPG